MGKVVVAFDQSYTNIGFSVYDQENKKLLDYGSVKLNNYPNRASKRSFIWGLAKSLAIRYNPDVVICEQIRLKNSFGINLATIIALAEITARIADAVQPLQVYTVDSKSWKAKVLGNGSAGKADSVSYIQETFGVVVDHDCADAICMSIYPSAKKPILNLYE